MWAYWRIRVKHVGMSTAAGKLEEAGASFNALGLGLLGLLLSIVSVSAVCRYSTCCTCTCTDVYMSCACGARVSMCVGGDYLSSVCVVARGRVNTI